MIFFAVIFNMCLSRIPFSHASHDISNDFKRDISNGENVIVAFYIKFDNCSNMLLCDDIVRLYNFIHLFMLLQFRTTERVLSQQIKPYFSVFILKNKCETCIFSSFCIYFKK